MAPPYVRWRAGLNLSEPLGFARLGADHVADDDPLDPAGKPRLDRLEHLGVQLASFVYNGGHAGDRDDRHRRRRDVHRHHLRRLGYRANVGGEDPVDTRRPLGRLHHGHPQGAGAGRARARRHHARVPRHDHGNQRHPRRQDAADGPGHHGGVQVRAGDRPPRHPAPRQPVRMEQAGAAHRPRPRARGDGAPRRRRRRPDDPGRGRGPERGPPARPVGRARRRRGVPPRLREPRPRAAHAGDPRRGVPRRAGVAVLRGAAAVPRVRAHHGHRAQRRGDAAGEPLRGRAPRRARRGRRHRAAPDHEIRRRRDERRDVRAPAGADGAVRPRRRRDRRGQRGARGRRVGRDLHRRRRHQRRHLSGASRATGDHQGRDDRRVSPEAAHARHPHDRRGGRKHRLGLLRRAAHGGAAERRGGAGPGVLRPGRSPSRR